MSVAFEVTDEFEDYHSGIYQEEGCGTTTQDVNHAVLATGYGVEGNVPYWNVKNSWGTGWGVNGYFKIVRGENMCAIAQCNAYPLIDRPEGLVEADAGLRVE
jgi:cathepsin H